MKIEIIPGFLLDECVFEPFVRGFGSKEVMIHSLYSGAQSSMSRWQAIDRFYALVELCASASSKRADWLGYSYGGLILIALASRYPERVRRIILLNSTPYFLADNGWQGITLEDYFSLKNCFVSAPKRAVDLFMRKVFSGSAPKTKHLRSQLIERANQVPLGLFINDLTALRLDLRAVFTKLKAPVLLIGGQTDKIIPVGGQGTIQSLNPKYTNVCSYNGGHCLVQTHTELLIKRISNFCEKTYG